MSAITQIEIDRVHHTNGDEVFGVYLRHSSGRVDWHDDYAVMEEAEHQARLLSSKHDCPILNTTATGLIRRPGEQP